MKEDEMGAERSTYGGEEKWIRNFGSEIWRKTPLAKAGRRSEYNIKLDLQYVRWEDMDMAQGRDQWLAVVKTVMNLRITYITGNSVTNWGTASSSSASSIYFVTVSRRTRTQTSSSYSLFVMAKEARCVHHKSHSSVTMTISVRCLYQVQNSSEWHDRGKLGRNVTASECWRQ
jgi:hypothetical protein